jgi:hypothetical protein
MKRVSKKSEKNKVSEPSATYRKSKKHSLTFFSSYDEMNEFDIKEMGQLTAEERFKHITFMVQSLYRDTIKATMTDTTIHFDFNE